MTWIEHDRRFQRTVKSVQWNIADRRGHSLLATVFGTSPPPGSNTAGGRRPPALPQNHAGATEAMLKTCFARQFLLAPKLRCLWSHPAGLHPGGYRKHYRRFTLIQEHEFNV
jgi:hypothetical protein